MQGPIFQLIDGDNLLAKNWEAGWPFSAVFAELTPNSAIGVDVQFKQFRIFGLIPVNGEPFRGCNRRSYGTPLYVVPAMMSWHLWSHTHGLIDRPSGGSLQERCQMVCF